VIRGYSIYFSLVNTAEEDFQHRQRRRKIRKQGYADWKGSFYQTMTEFKQQGEVLSNKYSNTETAFYELPMGVTG